MVNKKSKKVVVSDWSQPYKLGAYLFTVVFFALWIYLAVIPYALQIRNIFLEIAYNTSK